MLLEGPEYLLPMVRLPFVVRMSVQKVQEIRINPMVSDFFLLPLIINM